MVRLRVHQPGQSSSAVLSSAARYRIAGGSIWMRPGAPLLRYGASGWQHCGIGWPVVELQGPCRLVLGPLENPHGVSEPLDLLCLRAQELRLDREVIAVYEPQRNVWLGVRAGVRCQSFSIESASLRAVAYGLESWLPRAAHGRAIRGSRASSVHRLLTGGA
jgi:hypothetical protein